MRSCRWLLILRLLQEEMGSPFPSTCLIKQGLRALLSNILFVIAQPQTPSISKLEHGLTAQTAFP